MTNTHWESSKRPLFLKYVWDQGIRHTILSPDDPLGKTGGMSLPKSGRSSRSTSRRKLPRSPQQRAPLTSYRSEHLTLNELEKCIVNLQLELTAKYPDNRTQPQPTSPSWPSTQWRTQPRPASLAGSISDFSISDDLSDDTATNESIFYNLQIPKQLLHTDDEAERAAQHQTQTYTERFQALRGPEKNNLSERVIQWLDLAGTELKQDCERKSSQKPAKIEKKITPTRVFTATASTRLKMKSKAAAAAATTIPSVPSSTSMNTITKVDSMAAFTAANRQKGGFPRNVIPYKFPGEYDGDDGLHLEPVPLNNVAAIFRRKAPPATAAEAAAEILDLTMGANPYRDMYTISTNPFRSPQTLVQRRRPTAHTWSRFARSPETDRQPSELTPRERHQLHIFMPELPRRNPASDRISNIGSSLL